MREVKLTVIEQGEFEYGVMSKFSIFWRILDYQYFDANINIQQFFID